jgi:RHS repeat-associated protein
VADASTGDTLSVSNVTTPWPGGRTAASKSAKRRATRLEDPLGVMGSKASQAEAFGGAGNGAEASTDKLLAATTQSWIQAYTYDPYGNLTMPGGPSVSGTNNRISAAGYGYDAAGNLTGDAATGNVLRYDAENRLWKVETAGGTPIAQYWYDGEGRRVRKQVFGTNGYTMRFVYDVGGSLVAEYTTSTAPGSPSKEYIYGPSGLLATIEGTTVSYVTADHLGSPRVVTASGGSVTGRHDLKPFGEEIGLVGGRSTAAGYAGSDTLRQRFTSKERDAETGLDYFGARYYGFSHGRFVAPDALLSSGRPSSPQSWNRYAYVLNNPLAYTDPTGFYTYAANTKDDDKKKFEAQLARARNNLEKIKTRYGAASDEFKNAERAVNAYGKTGVDNGVVVQFGKTDKNTPGSTSGLGPVQVTIDMSKNGTDNKLLGTIVHEGSHVQDRRDLHSALTAIKESDPSTYDTYKAFNLSVEATETKAYTVQSVFAEFTYKNEQYMQSSGTTVTIRPGAIQESAEMAGTGKVFWDPSWARADAATVRSHRTKAISEGLRASSVYKDHLSKHLVDE